MPSHAVSLNLVYFFHLTKSFVSECCSNFDSVWGRKFGLLQERQHIDALYNNPHEATSTIPTAHISINIPSSFRMTCLVIHQLSNFPLADSKAVWKTRPLFEVHKLHLPYQNSCLECDSQMCLSQNRGMHVCSFRCFPFSCGDTLNHSLTVSILTAPSARILLCRAVV